MRKARAGSIQAAIQECYNVVGGLENVSDDLGLAPSTLSYGTEVKECRPGGLGANYLDRLARMHPGVAAILAEHFARIAGGRYAATGAPADSCIVDTLAALSKEGSEGELALLALIQGGCAETARKELRDLVEAAERGIRMIDGGNVRVMGARR